jgi:gluconate 5-dehydrogenase
VRTPDLFDLSGKAALVTGGGRGIGRHLAIGLAEAGARVFIASRKLQNCEEVAGLIERGTGVRAHALEADLQHPESIEALADQVLAQTSRLDILVNNAGVVWGAPTLDYPLEGWDKVFNVNVRGLWVLSQRIARHMRDQGGGSIIHVSSVSGYKGDFEEAQPAIAYNASKGAVITLTKDMAVKLAPFGIRVNGIAPGAFLTAMMAHISEEPAKLEQLHARIPMHRPGDEDDIKGAVVFLASDAAAYVTGHTLAVDGGMAAS